MNSGTTTIISTTVIGNSESKEIYSEQSGERYQDEQNALCQLRARNGHYAREERSWQHKV
jgi:hypothetical protein